MGSIDFVKSLSSSSPTILFVSTRQESTSTTVAAMGIFRNSVQVSTTKRESILHVSSFPSSKLSGLKESLSSSRETRCLLLEEDCSAGSTGTHTAAQPSLMGGRDSHSGPESATLAQQRLHLQPTPVTTTVHTLKPG